MRTRVVRTATFEAAHKLPWHPGRCRDLHGHSYRVEVTVEGPLNEHGIVVDFADLKAAVQREVLDRFDHRYLNDIVDNPTAELLAATIWKSLEGADELAGVRLARVRLWETEDSLAEIEG